MLALAVGLLVLVLSCLDDVRLAGAQPRAGRFVGGGGSAKEMTCFSGEMCTGPGTGQVGVPIEEDGGGALVSHA